MSTIDLIKQRLNQRIADEGTKFYNRTICVLELPFIVDESEITKYFSKCEGGVKSSEIFRSGALVFSAAIIEFHKPKGRKKAIEMADKFGGELDVIIVPAEDFMQDKIPTKRPSSNTSQAKKKECILQ